MGAVNYGKACGNMQCTYGGTDCVFWRDCAIFQPVKRSTSRQKSAGTTPTKIRPTETDEQIVVAQYCGYQRIPFVHIPNEGLRSKRMGALLKEMGMQKGFPDIHIPQAKNGYHGMYIELKRDRQARASKEQLGWIDYLNGQGYYAVIAYGADEAIAEIQKYMGVKR